MLKMPASPLSHYGSVLLALLLVTLLRLLLDPLLRGDDPLLLYLAVVVVVARYSGFGPATVALLGGALLANFLFVPPRGVLWLTGPGHGTALALYLIAGVLIIRLTGALRQNETLYRDLVENLYEGIWLIDRHHDTIFVNARMAKMLGYRVEEMLDRPLSAFMDEAAWTLAKRNLARGQTGVKADYEFEFQRKDGTPVTTQIATAPLFDDKGNYRGALAAVMDITARKHMEQALQQSNWLLDTVVNATHLLMCCLDRDFNFIWVNRAYAEADEREPEFFPGKNHFALYPNEENEAIFRRVVETGEPCFFQAKPFEYKEHPERGVTYWDWGLIPVKDATGEVERLVFTLLDVTARVRAEEALRASEHRYRVLVTAMPVGIYNMDLAGRCLYANRRFSEITGWPEEQLYGERWQQALYPEDRSRTLAMWQQAVQQRQPNEAEFRFQRPNGEAVWVYAQIVPEFDEEGEPHGFIGSITDITERKRAEEALQETDRRKDEFLATLAHELRNPLAPISNALQLLKRGGASDPAIMGQAIGMAERQMGQLVRLVDDLLDISRISRGKITLHKERVALDAVIRSALETTLPRIEAARHLLTMELPDEPVHLEADLTRLAQALSNLLINAAKFTDPGGHIQLRARCEGEEVAIAVQDNGVGIPAEQLPKVFGLFAQVEQPPARRRGGLGIGLALVKSLVELHGGRVEAASAGLGKGSTFTIRLPCERAAPAVAPAGEGPAADTAPSPHARRLLVVDDEADVADSLAMLLKTCGHEVTAVYDGAAAIEAARAQRPEAVVLDIGMPGLDGFEVARRLRELPGLHGIRIIALTGWGQEQDRLRSHEAGFDAHLIKPVDLAMLEAALR